MGTMGNQIGIACALAGFKTSMHDVAQKRVDEGKRAMEDFLARWVKRGKLSQEAMENALAHIVAGTDLEEAVGEVDLVIEAVYEDIQVKRKGHR
jgi:3-hydroxybutyryl-CoA dehydrogenase